MSTYGAVIAVMLGLSTCGELHDPDGTGLGLSPEPGEHAGCVTLVVENDAGAELECAFVQTDDCPGLDLPVVLADGERWTERNVCCAGVSASCVSTSGGAVVRSWDWRVR